MMNKDMAGKNWDCIFTDKERLRGQFAGVRVN